MKDRTQELRSVSLGLRKWGEGPHYFGSAWGWSGTGAGMWGQMMTGGLLQGRHNIWRHIMCSSEAAFWGQ